MRHIPLGGKYGLGKFALVDDQDFERISKLSWYLHSTGYAFHSFGDKKVRMHHMVLPKRDDTFVDHINHNKTDNRRSNLRYATVGENNANTKPRRDNTSGFKGVDYSKNDKKWRARVWAYGKTYYLGYYTSKEDAARAYDRKAKQVLGAFAYLNFPDPAHQSWRTTD